jgi:hypothetical protein
MFTKRKVRLVVGVLLVLILSLSGGVFSGDNVVHAQTESPTLYVDINFEWVDGWYWPLGDEVTLTIMEPGNSVPLFMSTKTVGMHDWDDATYVRFDLWEEGFNVEPRHEITLRDEQTGIMKSHTALYIEMTKVDVTKDTVEGYAAPWSELTLQAHAPCWKNKTVIANGDGYWLADFADSEYPDEICDLSAVDFVSAEQQGSEEGTSTGFYWEPPYLSVDIYYDTVFGWSWLPGTEVTLTIDGPDIRGMENFSLTKTVGVDTEFTPDTVQFDFRGDFYVQPGHTVTLSDGGVSVVYEVEYIEVTNVNPESKIIQGLADPFDEVLVTLGDPWTEKVISVDGNSTWETSFDDLVPGTWGMARTPAEYGNNTSYSWVYPMPTTYNINPWWSEETVRTDDDVILYVRNGACTRGLVESFQRAAHIDVSINGEPLFPQGDEIQYWGLIESMDIDGCKAARHGKNASMSYWQYQLSPLEPGIYDVYVHYWLDHPVIDGGDWDGDGKWIRQKER